MSGPSSRVAPSKPDVNYSPMFPDPEGNLRRPDNAAARVAYGDTGVKQRIEADAQAEARLRQHSDHNN